MAETSFKIGNDAFTVSLLPGEESFLLQPSIAPVIVEIVQLAALFARSLGGLPDDADAAQKIAAALPLIGEASAVVARLCAKLPRETLREMMRKLLTGATMNGTLLYQGSQGNPIDVLMQGRSLDIWRLVIRAMEVSYPDFFGLLSGFRVAAAKASPSETSATSSPGPAGGS